MKSLWWKFLFEALFVRFSRDQAARNCIIIVEHSFFALFHGWIAGFAVDKHVTKRAMCFS